MPCDMLRSRPWLGLLIGSLIPVLVTAPGCLKTLDESLIGQHNGSDGGGSGGSSGGGAGGVGGGSGGAQTDGGGTGGTAGDAAADAPHDSRPEAGFTPYDKTKHPVTNLLGGNARRVIAVDDKTVFVANAGNAQSSLSSVPIAGGTVTTVTTDTLSQPHAMIAPANSLFVFYVGETKTGGGVIGRFLKKAAGSNNEQSITVSTGFERAVSIFAGSDNYGYVSAKASGVNSPRVLDFSMAGGISTADPLLVAVSGNESGGPITMSQGCLYWISNGGIWTMPKAGGKASAALASQISDAVDIASDASNIYFTRSNGEVWQSPLSGSACDGSGAAEKAIAWGYQNIGHVVVYATTVAWGALGNATNSFAGGGIFTTAIGGYDVEQIAPPDKGVDDIAVGPTDVVFSTQDGAVHKVPKAAQ